MCVCVHIHVRVCVEARGQYQVSSSIPSTLLFLRQGLSQNLELTDRARKLHTSVCLHLLSPGITGTCHQACGSGGGVLIQLFMLVQQALY